MPSLCPDERAWPPVLKAGWLQQTFVHWPFRPADVQVLLPRGLRVDEYDGMAWVSFTPFVMAGLRPAAVPIKPRITTFPETNLRTYVRRPNGRDGIWFLSLEVGSAGMLAARCAVGAPYHLGDLSLSEHGDTVVYAGARRGGSRVRRRGLRSGCPCPCRQVQSVPTDVDQDARRLLGALGTAGRDSLVDGADTSEQCEHEDQPQPQQRLTERRAIVRAVPPWMDD
jgi:uncharacterized protein YqjF (DUF2071 family)